MKICKLKESGDRKYYCYFELALQVIGGKWKGIILYHLANDKVLRFGELRRGIPGITEKMLIRQLKELASDGLVWREVYKEVPPKVEYSLTDLGRTLIPILNELREWGVAYEKAAGLDGLFKDDPDYEQPAETMGCEE